MRKTDIKNSPAMPRKKERPSKTWTFQPDASITEMAAELLKTTSKTELVNAALRRHLMPAALNVAQEDRARADERVRQLEKLLIEKRNRIVHGLEPASPEEALEAMHKVRAIEAKKHRPGIDD